MRKSIWIISIILAIYSPFNLFAASDTDTFSTISTISTVVNNGLFSEINNASSSVYCNLKGEMLHPFMDVDLFSYDPFNQNNNDNSYETILRNDSAVSFMSTPLFSGQLDLDKYLCADESLYVRYYEADGTAHNAIKKQISFLRESAKKVVGRWLSVSSKYVPIIKNILAKKGLPEDLVYLPMIESGYNTKAVSKASAVGPWQFMKMTAHRFGLKVNPWVDERRDPIKSSEAAAEYLNALYEKFGSWELAIAAYNAGEGKIANALERARTNDFWSIYNTRHLKEETSSYVPRLFAAREIAANPIDYGFNDIDYKPLMDFDLVTIKPPASFEYIAKAANTTVERIRELNPELVRSCVPPDVESYDLRIPPGTKEVFMAYYDEHPDIEKPVFVASHKRGRPSVVSYRKNGRHIVEDSKVYMMSSSRSHSKSSHSSKRHDDTLMADAKEHHSKKSHKSSHHDSVEKIARHKGGAEKETKTASIKKSTRKSTQASKSKSSGKSVREANKASHKSKA